MGFNIAVVGATGNVGREMLNILAERNFPVSNVYGLASSKSNGKKVSFGEKTLEIQNLEHFDFSKADIALFSAGSEVSAEYAVKAAKHCIVIDNTSFFRMFDDVPLIVTEVNPKEIANYNKRNIIANPNCAVMELLVALKPLHDACKIKRLVLTTFQSVSGAGKSAMDELYNQTKGKFFYDTVESSKFPKQIAFNVIPHIGDFNSNGDTAEEQKVAEEVKKILDPNIAVTSTCVRVPIFIGHSISVNIEFTKDLSPEDARKILNKAKGIELVDDVSINAYVTPIECVGEDAVYVSRIRRDLSTKFGLNLWIVSDNLRKGAALNAVQIAEELVNNYI